MLRVRLGEISNGIAAEENIRQVELLRQTHPHSIYPISSEHALDSYTCMVHALGFTGKEEYLDIAGIPPGDVFAGAKFAQWLLRRGALIEISFDEASVGDLVWYFSDDGLFKHVGLLRDGQRVESKWGTLGLFSHAVMEVPESYGTIVRVFKQLSYDVAIDLFYDFAEENGIEFEQLPES